MKKEIFNLFLTREIPDNIFNYYLEGSDEGFLILQDFIGNYMKREISWSTSIGIIEACEHIYNCAVENGNIKI